MALSDATILAASGGETSKLPVLVDWITNPADPRITTNSFVGGINQDDFKEFECGILDYPIGVQNTEATTIASSPFLKR